jgi:hypothetical protein
MPLDVILVDAGAVVVVIWIVWYFWIAGRKAS